MAKMRAISVPWNSQTKILTFNILQADQAK